RSRPNPLLVIGVLEIGKCHPGETHLVDGPLSISNPVSWIRVVFVISRVVMPGRNVNDRSGWQQRCDLVLVWIRDVPAELIVAHTTDGFGTRGTRPRGIASDVRIDRFHAHRLTAVVHVRLKGCEKRRPGQPEIPIMPRDLSCRNIEVRGVSHVLRKRDVLWNYVFREHPKAELDGNRSLFTARIKVKIEIDLRPSLDQTSGVRRKDVSVFP